MAKLSTIEIYEDGEFVFGALMDSESFTELAKLGDRLSDESVLNATPEEMKAAASAPTKAQVESNKEGGEDDTFN